VSARAVVVLLAGALAGCVATAPRELVHARAQYARACEGAAAELAQADLHEALVALGAAERSFSDHGDSDATRDLAYAAELRAQIAEQHALAILAVERRDEALARLSESGAVRLTSGEVDTAKAKPDAGDAGR
jgi:hypothetical protein